LLVGLTGILASGCSTDSTRAGEAGTSLDSGSATTTAGDTTGGPVTSTSAGTTDSGTTPAGTTSSADATGNPGIFDLPEIPDAGGKEPPVMPTCNNLDDLGATSIGCEFWAAAVPVGGGFGLGWGLSVGNPFDLEVTITFEDMRGAGGTLREVHSFVLGPFESQLVDMNGAMGILPGEAHQVPGTGVGIDTAFRITSDSPVTAMQIAPIGGAPSYVPDASMLLPKNALGQAYYGMGYGIGWVIAVATEDQTTINTTSGSQVIDAFDTITFAPAVDPTGFFVGSDKPIAVFSGSSCTNVPAGAGWCDHIEEAVIPLAAWGTQYVGARHPHRQPDLHPTPELVYWRVIAGVDDVTIDVEPPGIVAGNQITLATAGQWMEFNTAENFTLGAADDEPFMLVQYMAGGSTVFPASLCDPGPPVGDPYMMQIVPNEQWLTQLPFLTDTSYAMDFVILVREAGSAVDLDCLGDVDDTHFVAIPGTPYEVGHVELDVDHLGGEGNCVDGQQFVVSDDPVGVMVGGYDCAASYGYPGGLSLDALWVPPTEPPG
jgi:hypothetical protein